MVFNSWIFLVFFIIVYLLYLNLHHRGQNILLLISGWVFYGFWDPKFLLLLWASTIVDYAIGVGLDRTQNQQKRKLLIICSLIVNLAFLGFFKYFDFFITSLAQFLTALGFSVSLHTLGIIVPVGISFYTFQSLGYTISVYRREIPACHHFLNYAVYVSFFPQLVAGPIERPQHLIHQVQKPRIITWEHLQTGFWLVLKGFFLKVFVADNLVKMVDPVFSMTQTSGGATLLAIYAFAFQIYGDFAGYSNIARGLSQFMGFDLMVNFSSPYLATNPRAFWQRWHISLSTWLRDFLYISLGGNRKGKVRTYLNLLITMFLGGLWHGAAWTYVLWGVLQGSLLCIHRFCIDLPKLKDIRIPLFVKIFFFFHVTCLGWIVFRSESISQILTLLNHLFVHFTWDQDLTMQGLALLVLIIPVLLLDLQEEYGAGPNVLMTRWPILKYSVYIMMFALLYIFGSRGGAPFIYFQF